MLTATYSLIALTVEQKKAQGSLSELQEYIRNDCSDLSETDRSAIEDALEKLAEFDEYCHRRKVELYVIPAVRNATHEADSLLAELESLSMLGLCILRSVRDRLKTAIEQGVCKLDELRCSLELYCNNLAHRLAKEEELFQIAQRVISGEEWFALAAKFLSYDAEKERQAKPPAFHIPRVSANTGSQAHA